MNGYEIVNRIWCVFFGMAIGMVTFVAIIVIGGVL